MRIGSCLVYSKFMRELHDGHNFCDILSSGEKILGSAGIGILHHECMASALSLNLYFI